MFVVVYQGRKNQNITHHNIYIFTNTIFNILSVNMLFSVPTTLFDRNRIDDNVFELLDAFCEFSFLLLVFLVFSSKSTMH